MELVVNNVSKRLNGKEILSNVNLKLSSGHIYGFVGVNGSGKTMLFRALSGLMKISEGEIICDGKKLHKDIKVLPNLGLILENAGLYPELTGFENLKLLAKLNKKIGDDEIRETIRSRSNGKAKLLSTKYINNTSPLAIQCECGKSEFCSFSFGVVRKRCRQSYE